MIIEVTSQTGDKMHCMEQHIIGILMPGLLSTNDTQCKLFLTGNIIVGMSEHEAQRVLNILQQSGGRVMMQNADHSPH